MFGRVGSATLLVGISKPSSVYRNMIYDLNRELLKTNKTEFERTPALL